MKKNKNIIATVMMVIMLTILLVAPIAFADNHEASDPNDPSVSKLDNPLKSESLFDFIAEILVVVRNIGFLVAVLAIVYSGFLFVTARGDATQITKARNALLWAIVGAAVLLGAWLFANAIKGSVEAIDGDPSVHNIIHSLQTV